MANFIYKQGNDYVESYVNRDSGFEVGYYSASEMKAAYPDGGIRVSGQFKYGKHEAGTMTVNGIEETVYRVDNSVRYKTIGYVELENGTYVAVKKDRILALILLVILGALVLAGLIAGLVFLILNGSKEEEPQGLPEQDVFLDIGQLEGSGIWDELPSENDMQNKNVTIRGITQINFKAGEKKQNFVLANDPKNENVCFMQYTIYIDNNGDKKIDDNDEMIYQSGLVMPGYSISHIELKRTLKAGTYKVIVLQQPYSWEQKSTKLNNMVNAVDMVVE